MRAMSMVGFKAQMCVTSPPYFGLRDYGHEGQLGLEQTPEQYVANMVEVFRLVRELLHDDGTLWLNIGDSYSNIGKSGGYTGGICAKGVQGEASRGCGNRSLERSKQLADTGLKPKDLIGIPWMLAFALRADGWYLRQDIIWNKPNPMPESVRDRCTKAHEYVFLLSKSGKYYFDNEAIKEPAIWAGDARKGKGRLTYDGKRQGGEGEGREAFVSILETRNRRSVWSVATRPYKGAHFATFPPALIEPCILAGSRPNDVVFDPFMGSGTTAEVAIKHGRQYLGCELNEAYKPLQDERIRNASKPTEG